MMKHLDNPVRIIFELFNLSNEVLLKFFESFARKIS